MKIYTILFAEDIPHYSSTEIEATDDAHALAIAESLDKTDLYYEGSWDSAVCKRIVSIGHSDGTTVFADIPFDDYFLRDGGAADRSLCEAASDLLEVVQYINQVLSEFTPDSLRNLGLNAVFEKAHSALAKATADRKEPLP